MAEFLENCSNVKMLPATNANAQLKTGNIGTGNIGNWQQFQKCITEYFAHFARDGKTSRFMAEFLEKCSNVKMLPATNANAQLDNGNIGTGNIGNWQQFQKCITEDFADFARDGKKPRFMAEFLEKCANVKMLPTANANSQLVAGNIGTGNIGNWQQFQKCITGNFARDFRSPTRRRMPLPRASPRRSSGAAFCAKVGDVEIRAPPPVLICKSETPSGIRVLTHDFPAF